MRVVCRGEMVGKLGVGEGWVDVHINEAERPEKAVGSDEGQGWEWKAMTLEQAVRAVIAIGGEEGRFEAKGTSAYFREYYEGEGWRGNFEEGRA